jgi:hypothetical protein
MARRYAKKSKKRIAKPITMRPVLSKMFRDCPDMVIVSAATIKHNVTNASA